MANDIIVTQQVALAISKLNEAQAETDDDLKASKALEALVPIFRALLRAASNGI